MDRIHGAGGMHGKWRGRAKLPRSGDETANSFWIDAGGRVAQALPDGGWVGVGEWGFGLRASSVDNQRPHTRRGAAKLGQRRENWDVARVEQAGRCRTSV